MKLKYLLYALTIACAFIIFSNGARSQDLSLMPVTEELGSWTPISGNYINNGDDVRTQLTMPFPFVWDNQNITYIYVNTNGFISMNWSGPSISGTPGYYSNGYNIIAWAHADLYVYGGVYYEVSGTAPKRVLTIQWNNTAWYSAREGSMYAQIKLFEGTNSAQVIYGPGVYNFPGTHTAGVYFSGAYYYTYGEVWNIRPMYPSSNISTVYWCPNGNSANRTLFLTQSTNDLLVPGYTYTCGMSKAQVSDIWPSEGVNLVRGYVYGNGTVDMLGQGNNQRPRVQLKNVDGSNPSTVHYTISGPVSFPAHPNYHIIYDATNTYTQSDVQLNLTTATTPLLDPGDNKAFGAGGNLDLSTNQSYIYGGVYNIHTYLYDGEDEDDKDQTFNIAYSRNLEITKALDPKPYTSKKYPLTARIPIKLIYTSRGISQISSFAAVAKIYNMDDQAIYEDSIYWEAESGQELNIGDSKDLVFRQFQPTSTGRFRFWARIYVAGDVQAMDDYLPWLGQSDLVFEVAPEIEAEAFSVIRPNNTDQLGQPLENFVGRPIEPIARFKNNGITDISDAPSTMTITRLSDGTIVYTDNQIVPDIPQGLSNNKSDVFFSQFIPPTAGDYQVCVTVEAIDDEDATNNTICDTFRVIDALNGIYTIGPAKNTGNHITDSVYNARNFSSLQSALNLMFLRGVTGPVVFEFTTNSYNIGDMTFMDIAPAIDLTSKVVGMSDVNTVTFRPSAQMSASKGQVVINLYSGGGIGVLFGQSISTSNTYAVVNSVKTNLKKSFANPAGKFIFDGGSQKALKFIVHSGMNFATAFYLSQGASNVTVQNCIIENSDNANAWQQYKLPVTRFSDPQFMFEADSRSGGTDTYTAGITMRSVPPIDKIDFYDNSLLQDINTINIDTLVNQNNILKNNEISGFAYGIVSIGIGPLLRDGLPYGFYNTNNKITGNFIKNVSKAGIFLGFENGSEISNNKISGVANPTTGYLAGTDVAGIEAGGLQKTVYKGYNNMSLTISGNEISNVGAALNDAGNRNVSGIKIEQCHSLYQNTAFPNVEENMTLMNNVIWGIVSANANTNRFGIRLYTQRTTLLGDWYSNFKAPLAPAYFTRNDKIVNNTIIIPNDGYNSAGVTAAISLQNSKSPFVCNNAFAMLDDNNPGATNQYAAIFYEGFLPYEDGGIVSERNVFWTQAAGTPNDYPSVVRFIHADDNSFIINEGLRNEYLTMNQWQMFSGQDFKSVMYNFTNDLTNPNIALATDKLRINDVPTWPKGSALNNRAEKLDYVLYDIDGAARGGSGQRPDIGAFEFPGLLLNSDLEITTAFQPGAYRSSPSTSPIFSEAEYIMTTTPVEVKAELRNNGSLMQSGVDVKVQIYREKPRAIYADPVEYYAQPELEETVRVTIPSTETYQVAFNLADHVGKDFNPTTYGEWFMRYVAQPEFADSMYTVPDWFVTMKENVTPLYKIKISVRSDEENSNNVFEKVCRFYIKKSIYGILLSVENSYSPFGTADVNAGRRNYDSLVTYISRLGWKNEWTATEGFDTTLIQIYDVFDRTSWEPRAVDYSIYQTMIWSDGDDKELTRQEVLDLEKFLNAGDTKFKQNLIIGSQEMVRENYAAQTDFMEDYLSVKLDPAYPADPLNGPAYFAGPAQPAFTINDDTRWIQGVNIGRGMKQYIMQTGILPADPDPVPGLMTLYGSGEGLSQVAFTYNPDVVVETTPGQKETTMGIAAATLTKNVIVQGVDWRHYSDGESIIRADIDFLIKNGSFIVPVELTSFIADLVGDRVEISWSTASEYNTKHFDVERSELTSKGRTSFAKIAETEAAGKSSNVRNYGPIVDRNIENNSTYIYRLRTVDIDGQYDLSGEVEVSTGSADGLWLSDPVPNPAKYSADVQFSLGSPAFVEITLFDVTGKAVRTLFSGMAQSGVNPVVFNLQGLNSGVYTYVIKAGDKALTKQIRIVK